jgi:putative spermidine/putrescine transport system permease protein
MMLLPILVLLAIFIVGIIDCLAVSLGFYPAAGLTTLTFDYYIEMFARGTIGDSLLLSLYYSLVAAAVSVALGVLLSAAAVATGLDKTRLFQLFKAPIIVPHAVCALLAVNLLAQSGLLARLCYQVGILESQTDFFSFMYSPGSLGVILTYIWKEAPFALLVVITIMGSINASLGDAATNLGASRWHVLKNITLPLCLPSITTAFIIIFAYSFGAYEIPFLLGATEPKALPVQAYVEYIYPSMDHRPYSMVLNSIMILFTVGVSYIYYKLQSQLYRPKARQ